QLWHHKREVELAAEREAKVSREKELELQLGNLPAHHQQLMQAEVDRVGRWEDRLVADAVALQRREEAQRVELERGRELVRKEAADAQQVARDGLARERGALAEARDVLARERGQLMQRVAEAEGRAQAKEAELCSLRSTVEEGEQRLLAEGALLAVRAASLEPRHRALEEGHRALEAARGRVEEEARAAAEELRIAREKELELKERENLVEVKWQEARHAQRAAEQAEGRLRREGESLAEQRHALSLARVRVHEKEMQVALQVGDDGGD
ncbi:unnamed protein product, partial [Discosporangium mesarthrocarpum]